MKARCAPDAHYEFTIDAYTGAVLEWDTDWDD